MNKKLVDVLPGGSWAGKPAYVIGGGPSLIGFDWTRLKGRQTIAVNRAFEYFEPAITFSMDGRFLTWILQGTYGEAAKKKFLSLKGHKVWLATRTARFPGDVLVVPVLKNYAHSLNAISWKLEDGIGHGNNSGFAAFNLAICLGANPIYLLGFDFKHLVIPAERPRLSAADKGAAPAEPRVRSHFHDGHPIKSEPAKTASYRESFERHAEAIRDHGIRVVNLNRDSALRCFEFGDIEKLPDQAGHPAKKPRYIVISYFTTGTGYEEVVEHLRRSLKDHGLQHHIFSFPPTGTWRGNLNYKSGCILKAMDLYPGQDIVFIDADAIVRQRPILFDELSRLHEHEISAHYFRYRPESGDADELLSGTLWIQNSPQGRKLVDEWHKIGLASPTIRHQLCLKMAIEALQARGEKIRVNRHPFSYTCIYDYPLAKLIKPVIEHFQASRKFRRQVGYGVNMIARQAKP